MLGDPGGEGRGRHGMEPVYSAVTETLTHWRAALHAHDTMDVGSAEARALEVKIDRLQDRYQAIIDSDLSWQRRARVSRAR